MIPTNPATVQAAVTAGTNLVWLETLINLLPDEHYGYAAAIAAISKKANALLCVDNTFASPYLQTSGLGAISSCTRLPNI
ncbi:MAG: PLP-dependent transferase [Chitinophagaceae bacterium]|nr:PLP-dependent transferase [Chitinophagaceae bacterium]